MAWFVTSIILIIVGLGGILLANAFEESTYSRVIGGIVLGLGFIILLLDSFTVVPARNVGIQVTFGKAEHTISNGFHWVKPWSSIEKIDATVQNFNLASDSSNCVTVRLQNQTTACVDVTVQWNIDQHANANELWQRYRGTNDNVVANVGKNVV